MVPRLVVGMVMVPIILMLKFCAEIRRLLMEAL